MPGKNEDMQTAAGRWLTTLDAQGVRAQAVVEQVAAMVEMVQQLSLAPRVA